MEALASDPLRPTHVLATSTPTRYNSSSNLLLNVSAMRNLRLNLALDPSLGWLSGFNGLFNTQVGKIQPHCLEVIHTLGLSAYAP